MPLRANEPIHLLGQFLSHRGDRLLTLFFADYITDCLRRRNPKPSKPQVRWTIVPADNVSDREGRREDPASLPSREKHLDLLGDYKEAARPLFPLFPYTLFRAGTGRALSDFLDKIFRDPFCPQKTSLESQRSNRTRFSDHYGKLSFLVTFHADDRYAASIV